MKRYLYNYVTHLSFSHPVERHTVKLRCLPEIGHFQRLQSEHFVIDRSFEFDKEYLDVLGNRCLLGWVNAPHSSLAYVSTGVVEQERYQIKEAVVQPYYRMQSAMTHPSAAMKQIRFVRSNDVIADAMAISQYVFDIMTYRPGSTNTSTTAAEAFCSRAGVCQDYAHVMISLCRLNGIACRYSCGMILGEGETHAWVEVWIGDRWIAVDPCHNAIVYYGYIKLAHGRDAADCQLSRGTFFGNVVQQTDVRVDVWEV